MSGNYPDGLNQAGFDRYWNDKLDDPEDDYDDRYDDRVNDPPRPPETQP